MDGSECRRCDVSWRTRFPPAESPTMTMFPGEIPLLRRCASAALACFNWVGKGESGVSAKRGVLKMFAEQTLMGLTVLQRYDTDVTEGSGYVFL